MVELQNFRFFKSIRNRTENALKPSQYHPQTISSLSNFFGFLEAEGPGSGHEKVRHRSAVLQLQMALSLVLALTLPPFPIIPPRFINHSPWLLQLKENIKNTL